MKNVGIIIPTYNGGVDWSEWLKAFNHQREKPDYRLIIDSSSTDETRDLARSYGFDVEIIKKEDFDHGAIRQLGFEKLKDSAEIIIFMTQDAILVNSNALNLLIGALDDPKVGAAYGRQLPRRKANPIETHARLYNYPSKSIIKSISKSPELGIKNVFISNSFAAYHRDSLVKVGGFPKNHIFAEDMYVAAKMGLKGLKIVYCADAKVYHSHGYTYLEEFRRYFDNGVFHARESWIQEEYGKAENEGFKYVLSELNFLGLRYWYLIPSSVIRNFLKLVGYKFGKNERLIPLFIKRMMSMNSAFWGRENVKKAGRT